MKSTTLKAGLFVSVLALGGAAAFGQFVTPLPATSGPTNTPWDITASAGVTITRGNSDTTLAVAKIFGIKKWNDAAQELDLDLDGTYGRSSINGVSETTANQVHGFAQFNQMFSQRFYGYLRVEGLRDEIAKIDYRIQVSPGAGYFFIKETNTFLRGEIGPGYIYEKDDTSTDNTHSYATLRLAERFETKLSEHSKLWEGVEFLPQVDKFSNYIITSEIGIDSAITKKLSLQTYLQDWYHSDPAVHRLKNDVQIVAALAYKF